MIPTVAQSRKKTQHLCFPPPLSFLFRGIIHIKCFPFLLDFTNHHLPKQSFDISIFLASFFITFSSNLLVYWH